MNAPVVTDTFHLFGNLVQFRLRPAETGHAFLLSHTRSLPGAGAPPNKHVEDEAFYVLNGEVEFTIDGHTARHGPGSLVRIPNDAVHSFRNVGDAPSEMLIINWPGGDHERFFSTAGEAMPSGSTAFPAGGPPPDPAAVMNIGAECRMTFFPPGG